MTAGPVSPLPATTPRGPAAEEDARYMAAALNLARRHLGRVAPNPAVGALIVKEGAVVGRGFTGIGGRPHAETIALQEAGHAAADATLFVTLEPCSHHGKTPPCADAILAAGIARVVSALADPDPRVAGQGHARLAAAGVALRTGVLADAAMLLNLGHILRVTRGRPMLSLKLAETADGYAADAGPRRLMITGAAANAQVHMWRALHDAILIGSRTAVADDPLLTVRLPGMEDHKPLRVVLDSRLVLAATARLATTAKIYPTLVIASEAAPATAEAALAAEGVEVLRLASDSSGRLDLARVLAALAARGVTRIFCEGGPRLGAALLQNGFVDEVMRLTGAERLAAPGVPALDEASRALLRDPGRYRRVEDRAIGPDRLRRYERLL